MSSSLGKSHLTLNGDHLRWASADAVPSKVTINGRMWIQQEAALKDKLTQAFSLFKGSKIQIVSE